MLTEILVDTLQVRISENSMLLGSDVQEIATRLTALQPSLN